MSVIKKERECSGYSNGMTIRGFGREDNQRGDFRGTSNTRLFRVGELEPYNPVGRNKLPEEIKREQKNTRATYYYQSDSIKKRIIYSKKRNSYVKCNEGKRQKNSTKGKSQDGLNDLVSQCAKPS